jgi:hypothetical protein
MYSSRQLSMATGEALGYPAATGCDRELGGPSRGSGASWSRQGGPRQTVRINWARNELDLTFKVVKKPPNQVGFKVLPRRWIVERSLSWLMRARRNSRDYERLPEHSEAHITWANITLLTRRLARARSQESAPTSLPAA